MRNTDPNEPTLLLRRNRIVAPLESLQAFEIDAVRAALENEIGAILDELRRLNAAHPPAADMVQ